jgi:hypothetical protein
MRLETVSTATTEMGWHRAALSRPSVAVQRTSPSLIELKDTIGLSRARRLLLLWRLRLQRRRKLLFGHSYAGRAANPYGLYASLLQRARKVRLHIDLVNRQIVIWRKAKLYCGDCPIQEFAVFLRCMFSLSLILSLNGIARAQGSYSPRDVKPSLVCNAGYLPCFGTCNPSGSCYTTATGSTCYPGGVVCPFDYYPCKCICYKPSAGQSCN